MRRLATSGWHLLRSRSGLAATEFALIAPLAALVLCTVVDVGGAMWRTMRLESAARFGAQYAFSDPQGAAAIAQKVRDALPGWTNVTVASTVAACTCDNGTPTDCTTGVCTVNGVSFAPILRLAVTVTQPFQFISPLTAALFPKLAVLQGNVEVRLH
jgi:Flp pilus assembly protein TadG